MAEYASNYIAFLQTARKTGVKIEPVPNDDRGQISTLERLEPHFLDLHAAEWVARDRYQIRPDARRFENWETNTAGKIGLGVAIDYASQWGLDAIWARVKALAEDLRAGLEKLPGVTVRDLGVERCGIVAFTVDGKDPEAVRRTLAQHNINVSVSTQSATRLDMEARGLDNLVRASVHYCNSGEEIERFCAVLASVL